MVIIQECYNHAVYANYLNNSNNSIRGDAPKVKNKNKYQARNILSDNN